MTHDDIAVAVVLGWFTLMIVLIRGRAGAPWRRSTGRPRLEILPTQDADGEGRPGMTPASTGSPIHGSAPERQAAPTPKESIP